VIQKSLEDYRDTYLAVIVDINEFNTSETNICYEKPLNDG
jgi:hypothetical protein